MPAQNQTIKIDETKTYQTESDFQPSFILFSFLFVTSVQIGTHKFTDKLTSLHTNSEDNIGFDVAKCAAQLLYGPVLVFLVAQQLNMSNETVWRSTLL